MRWLDTLTGRRAKEQLAQMREQRPPSATDREAELLDMLSELVDAAAGKVVQDREINNRLWQVVIRAKQIVNRRKNLRDPDIKL
jgi:hypothetical protein